MDVIVWELFVKVVRYPGAILLSVVTRRDVSYWLDSGSTYGVFLVGSLVMTLFILVATWASG